jgi:hypothetical protein
MLGFSKDFVIVLFICLVVWYGTKNILNALVILAWYAIIKIIWKFVT